MNQFSSGGQIQTCHRFVESVLADDPSYDNCWQPMGKHLRLNRTQAWLWNIREFKSIAGQLEELASHLVADPHLGEFLWEQFSAIELSMVRDAWQADYLRKFGVASQPRLIGPNYEFFMESQQSVDNFTNTEGHAFLAAQIDAGGIGINLQAESVIHINGGAIYAFDRMAGNCAGAPQGAKLNSECAPNTCCQHY